MGPKYSYTRMLFVFFILLHLFQPIFAAKILPPPPEEDDYSPLYKWPEKTLKYAFLQQNPVNYLSETDVKMAFSRGFATWSTVIPVSFEQTDNLSLANATIGFFRGDHGDDDSFENMSGGLAHTWSWPNGTIHVNADVRWAVDFRKDKSKDAFDLESMAAHEIGHLLGLAHTEFKGAIMYPTGYAETKVVDLTIADVILVQGVYGLDPNFNWSSLHSSGWSILKESRRFPGRLIVLFASIVIMIL